MLETRVILSKILVGMIFLVMPFFLICQSSIPNDTLAIDSLISTARSQLSERAYNESKVSAIKAINASQKLEDWGRWYKGFDRLAYVYFYKGDFDSLGVKTQYYLDKIQGKEVDPIVIAKLYGWIGFASFYTGDRELYLTSNLESARIYESIGKAELATSAYINIGITYTMKGDYKNAGQYLHQAEANAMAQNNTKKFYNIWINLGKLYWAQKDLDKAIDYYNKATELRPVDFTLSYNLAACYRDKSDLKTAQKYLDITKSLVQSRQDSFTYIMELAKLTNESDKRAAQELFQEAIILGEGLQEIERELAQCYIAIGDLKLQNGDIPMAKNGYTRALSLLDTSIHRLITEDLNSMAINKLSVLNGPWIMESIYGLAKTETLSPGANENLAYQYFTRCFDVIDYIRLNFNSESSSLILGDYARKIYQSAMSYAFENVRGNMDSRTTDFIVTCLERSRSFLLSSNLNDMKAKDIANIPDSLLNREKKLQEQIALHDTKKSVVTDIEYFSWLRELEELNNYYKLNYPSYYALTNASKSIALSDIRDAYLKPQQALIYYFEMPDTIYQVGITKADFVVNQIPKTQTLLDQSNAYNRILSQQNNNTGSEVNFDTYVNSAYYLYKTLLGDLVSRLDNDIDDLIILPDGLTHKVTFEALLENEPNGSKIGYDLNTLDYLLESYNISYAYAINLSRLSKKPQRHKEQFIGLAPNFDSEYSSDQRTCTPEGLFNLRYSESEILDIQKTIGGISYTQQDANKTTFLKAMNEAKIVHLATHACIDESSPDQHKIFFSNREYLNTAELYNVKSQAEMVVLSACETGLGQYHSGEGVLSLARTFAYVGIPSVVMSLWSLPDRSTSDIMKFFYKELQSKLPKHKALQQAKLAYINQADPAHQHPHYWAALVLIGDTHPVVDSWSMNSVAIWSILFLILLFVLYRTFGKKS